VANLRETAASPSFQQFSRLEKAGGGVEPLGRTPKKNHPVQIVRKMPLAYDNQRAPKSDSAISPARGIWCATLLGFKNQ
jgi:hypothetical protein